MRMLQLAVQHQRKTEKTVLKINWIVVTEHGEQQLRMVWTVPSPIPTLANREVRVYRDANNWDAVTDVEAPPELISLCFWS